jgi:hypothetical protein
MGHEIGLVGGYFALLTFGHFFVDWLSQSHNMAVRKAHEPMVRATHCLGYCLGMLPLLFLVGLPGLEMAISLAVLFVTHYIGDSYLLVFWWFKYIRRPPWMKGTNMEELFHQAPLRTEVFIGIVLMLVVDQIWHVLWLLVPAFLAVYTL